MDQQLHHIFINQIQNPSAPPANAHVIGLICDVGHYATTLSSPITLTFSYDTTDISVGVSEDDLVLANYNSSTGLWNELPSEVNVIDNTITAQFSHFCCVCYPKAMRCHQKR